MSHVMTELTFFQVEIEVLGPQSAADGQADFGHAPEALDAVDAIAAGGELVAGAVDAVVLPVAPVDQGVVGPPAVGIDGA